MSSPQLHVEGPFNPSNNKQGSDLDLYLGEQADDEAETDTKQKDIPTEDDESSLLAPIQGKREVRLNGKVAGAHIRNEEGYSDSKEALVQWLLEFESLVQPEMGIGYKLIDDVRGETFDPTGSGRGILFGAARWTYESGSGVNAEWELEGQVGEGVQNTDNRDNYVSSEDASRDLTISSDSLEAQNSALSFPLGDLEKRSYEREVDLDVMDMMHQFDVPTVGVIETGVKGSVDLRGRISRNDVSSLAQAAREINDDFHGIAVEFEDAVTQRRFKGAVSESSTTFEEGRPDIMDYRVEVTLGENLTP